MSASEQRIERVLGGGNVANSSEGGEPESLRCCVCCRKWRPPADFYWQITVVQGQRARSRDRTCKACRHEQKRQKRLRDRARLRITADDVIARFLRLPVPR